MPVFEEGDRVKIDIPDESDPDFQYHGSVGEVTGVVEDDVETVTGDERDAALFFVELDSGQELSLRWRDLRPLGDLQ